jgi:hypothetical protein
MSLACQKTIDGERLVIEGKRIERTIEDFRAGTRMGWKGISNTSAIFEKSHRNYDIS